MGNTIIINRVEEFRSLKDEWDSFLGEARTNTIFLTWEWLYSWWEVFGRDAQLFIVISRDDKGRLDGIAPLHIRKTKYYQVPIKELTFIGMGHSDRQDFIVPADDVLVIDKLLDRIFKDTQRWDLMHLEQIPPNSLLNDNNVIQARECLVEPSSVCPYVALTESWDEYSRTLGKGFWSEMRRVSKKLNNFGEWEFVVSDTRDNPGQFILIWEEVETKSRKMKSRTTFLSNKSNKRFLSEFLGLCSSKGWLDFSSIFLNGSVIACLIGFLYYNKYYFYNTAFNEDYREASPGKILVNEKMKWCFENQEIVNEFDFLRGDAYYKLLWASNSEQHSRMIMFNSSSYSRLLRSLVVSVRPRVKHLKEKIRFLKLKTQKFY